MPVYLTIRRRYLLDGRPLALTEVHYPPEAGIAIDHADLTIRAAPPDADLAAILGLPADTTALVEKRLTYCPAGVPREHRTRYLHPDSCERHLLVRLGQALVHAVRPTVQPG